MRDYFLLRSSPGRRLPREYDQHLESSNLDYYKCSDENWALVQAAKVIVSLAGRENPAELPPVRARGDANPYSRKRDRPMTKRTKSRYPATVPREQFGDVRCGDSVERMAVDSEDEEDVDEGWMDPPTPKRARGRKNRRRPKRQHVRPRRSSSSSSRAASIGIDMDIIEHDDANKENSSHV